VAAAGQDNWDLLRAFDRLNGEWDRAGRGHAETAQELRREAAACETSVVRLVLAAEAHDGQAADVARRKVRGLYCRELLARQAAFFAETERTLDPLCAAR